MSREEKMLKAIVDGSPITDEPCCRREHWLKAICNGEDISTCPKPRCREEELYAQIVKKCIVGGKVETEDITVNPTIDAQTITRSTGKYINQVTVEGVTNSIDSNIVAENIKKDVTILGVKGTLVSGERDEHETMKEMQEADYMRFVQGIIGLCDIPTDAEYLEQEQYINATINNIMREEF